MVENRMFSPWETEKEKGEREEARRWVRKDLPVTVFASNSKAKTRKKKGNRLSSNANTGRIDAEGSFFDLHDPDSSGVLSTLQSPPCTFGENQVYRVEFSCPFFYFFRQMRLSSACTIVWDRNHSSYFLANTVDIITECFVPCEQIIIVSV